MEPRKRILVTGGAGLIGSHLCLRLLGEGHEVYCMDLREADDAPALLAAAGEGRLHYVRHDVTRPFSLHVDAIYHLASPAALRCESAWAVETLRVNLLGSFNCLDTARLSRASVLFASSGDVYGWSARQQAFSETQPCIGCGTSPLPDSKRAAESIHAAYRLQYQVDCKVARLFNTYGPGAEPDDRRVVPRMIMSAIEGRDVVVYGSGRQLRSLLWVEDAVEALVRLMQMPPMREMPVVNVGNPHEISIRELAEKIIALAGSRSRILHLAARNDDPRQKTPDIARARDWLGWEPAVSLEEGLRRTIAYFQRATARTGSRVEVY